MYESTYIQTYKTNTSASASTSASVPTTTQTPSPTQTQTPTPTPSPPPVIPVATPTPPLHISHSHSSDIPHHSHYQFNPYPIPLTTALTAISPSPQQSPISPLSASSSPSTCIPTPTANDTNDTCTSPHSNTEIDEPSTTSLLTHKFRVACLQLNTGDDINGNIITTSTLIRRAVAEGAQLIVTPENTGCMNATVQKTGIDVRLAYYEEDHPALHAYRELATELNVWILIGSLAIRTRHDHTRLVNRSFLLAPAHFILKPHSIAARMAYQLQTTTSSNITTSGTNISGFLLRTSSSSDLTLARPPTHHHHTQSSSISSLNDPMSTFSISSSGAMSPHRSDSPTSMAQDDNPDSPTSSLPSSIHPSPSLIDRSPGHIICRYDKIHMFDVPSLNALQGESYHESMRICPGQHAVLCQTPWGNIGMTICYDLRFPHLYRCLAQQGAYFISIPAAFTRITGEAHWHILLRARAIETGCYIFAPAQCGIHPGQRKTYGHTLIISPWGEILADAGSDHVGYVIADIDTAQVMSARSRVPSLMHDRPFDLQICDI